MEGYVLEYTLVFTEFAPLDISFRADYFGTIVAVISSAVWLLVTFYSIGYMKTEHSKSRYYSFMTLTAGTMFGILFAKNLFTLYIFFELMTIVSYVLVIHEETEEALKAGKKYVFILISFGLLLFFSIVITYTVSGTIDFGSTPMLADITENSMLISADFSLTLLFFTFLFGFGAKAGMVPVHIWLPVAHPIAPSPASALLSGVMIKSGAYGIIRVVYDVFGVSLVQDLGVHFILAVLGAFTIFFGAAVAMAQNELKRRLAYSSINQIGYVILGAAFLTHNGVVGSILHIFNHALMKGLLFLCAGAIIYKTGIKYIDNMSGLGSKMPITMICFSIGALSMMGIPPFCGFISKWILVLGALDVGFTVLAVLAGVFLLSALMDAVYYFPIIRRAFFCTRDKDIKSENLDPSLWMLAPIIILAFSIVFFGIFPRYPLELIEPAADALLSGL